MAIKTISIYFGTETGNCRSLAEALATRAAAKNIKSQVFDMMEVSASRLLTESNPCVFVISTWDNGQPPFMARRFFVELKSGTIKANALRFAVIALGDEHYDDFCRGGKTLDALLDGIGGQRFMPCVELGRNYVIDFVPKAEEMFRALAEME